MDINAVLMRRRVKSPVAKSTKRATPRKESPSKAAPAASSLRSGAAKRKLLATAAHIEDVRSSSSPKKPRTAASKGSATAKSSLFSSTPVKAVSRTQAYIDVGQKSFGKYTTCKKCGLLYTIGEEEDEKEHERFCKISQKGVVITKWKNERLLKSFPDEKARIIEIRRDDPPTHVHKLMEIKSLLDDALGFVDEPTFLQRSHYVYIHDKQVVGCTTVERIEKAFPLDPTSSNLVASIATESDRDNSLPVAALASSDSHAAVVGICQIWVHPAFRGKKIATRLVDTVREKFIYGMRIAKHQVAFAQLTKNGRNFAEKYIAPHQVLVYDDISN